MVIDSLAYSLSSNAERGWLERSTRKLEELIGKETCKPPKAGETQNTLGPVSVGANSTNHPRDL